MRWKGPTNAAFAAAVMLAASIVPAFAQTPENTQAEGEDNVVFDRACMDDYGRDLCDQGVWAEIVARFGLDSAEVAQRQGLRGVRVFTIDGYSNDMPSVSILASTFDQYGEPENAGIEVRRQIFRDETKAGPAILKSTAWSTLYEKASDLQELVTTSPERQTEDDEGTKTGTGAEDNDRLVTICLHAWVTVTESLTDEGVTRRIRNACGSDPVFDASYEMSAIALHGFPYCNHLDPGNYRNESAQLQRCFSLDGADKVAAADVTNLFDSSLDAAADLGPHLAQDVQLTRPDRTRVSGAPAVQAALADPALEDFDLRAGRLVGAPDRVVAIGWLSKYADQRGESAEIEFTWRRRDNAWRIVDIDIGPMKFEK